MRSVELLCDQVSLDSKVKQNLMRKKDDPPRDIFEEAQAKIFSLMQFAARITAWTKSLVACMAHINK